MEYQLVKHNKTCTRQIGLFDTLEQAKREIMSMGGNLVSNAYAGGFPIFNANCKVYSIQGSVLVNDTERVVCSIDKKELAGAGLIY